MGTAPFLQHEFVDALLATKAPLWIAAYRSLRESGRSLTTKEILAAARRQGWRSKQENPDPYLRSVLLRTPCFEEASWNRWRIRDGFWIGE